MSGLDPIPHLRIAQKPPSSKFGCPVATHARLVQFWLTGLKNGSLDKPEQSELGSAWSPRWSSIRKYESIDFVACVRAGI
jgi:hypothetical protein